VTRPRMEGIVPRALALVGMAGMGIEGAHSSNSAPQWGHLRSSSPTSNPHSGHS